VTQPTVPLSEVLEPFDEWLGPAPEPVILTLTEKNGFIPQAEKYNKRVARVDTSGYRVVRRFDVAFNPYLLWAGAIAQNVDHEKAIISPAYPTFRVRPGYNPRWVDLMLRSRPLMTLYDTISFGSVPRRRRAATERFLGLEIRRPATLGEQQRMAAILDQVDAIRRKRAQANRLASAFLESAFVSMFERQTTWPTMTLDEIVGETKLGLVRGATELTTGGNAAYVRMNSITREGELDLRDVLRTEVDESDLAEYALHAGDLLFNTRNSRDLVGKMALFEGGQGFVFNNNLMRMRLGAALLPEFLVSAWRRPVLMRQLENMKSGTTSVFAIYWKNLKTLEVPVPPMALQKRFARLRNHVRAMQQQLVRGAYDGDSMAAVVGQDFFEVTPHA